MSAPPRRRRRGHEEEHEEGSERWLVTYADMVTLLMVLFIILFSMSTVNEEKYQELKTGLAEGFGRSTSILNGENPTLDYRGPASPSDPSYSAIMTQMSASERKAVEEMVHDHDRRREQQAEAEARSEVDRLFKVWREIDEALRAEGLQDDVRATIDERGLVVSLVSRHVVFQPNIADLTVRGQRVVDTIAPVLRRLPEPIQVDGHTNQVPVKPKYYPTDWDLSVARAVDVLRRLQEVDGLQENRLRATGFGHTKPLVDPHKRGSQRVNKRVDLVVLSQASAATRARFADVYEEMRTEEGTSS
ncbi:flagellar motor protein MotB [Nocardioides humilatus]|uniref:Flagellar motor protein MotB n=1 Tax=Nocardioides humilatus TaxID=2607660 RepID=A0A5B1LB84_9ACTN|nr:flagellar motor protein MotB [Nocardioides humilatus]KAA1417696.1 flagellar motor protein MotB [Nocardioides humilatus]